MRNFSLILVAAVVVLCSAAAIVRADIVIWNDSTAYSGAVGNFHYEFDNILLHTASQGNQLQSDFTFDIYDSLIGGRGERLGTATGEGISKLAKDVDWINGGEGVTTAGSSIAIKSNTAKYVTVDLSSIPGLNDFWVSFNSKDGSDDIHWFSATYSYLDTNGLPATVTKGLNTNVFDSISYNTIQSYLAKNPEDTSWIVQGSAHNTAEMYFFGVTATEGYTLTSFTIGVEGKNNGQGGIGGVTLGFGSFDPRTIPAGDDDPTTTTPEPATFVMFGIGLCGLALVRRFGQK